MSPHRTGIYLPRSTRWIIALAGLITLALLTWLPYRVPVTPTFSDSYLFGYNNRVALALVVAFMVGVGLLASRTTHAQPLEVFEDEQMPGIILSRALAFTFTLAVPLHLIVRRTGGYIESPYFLDRIKLILEGKLPYRDFEYVYGAGLLYLPASISRFLHLPVADAYGVFWLAINFVGICLLFQTLQWVPSSTSARRGSFYFLFGLSILGLLSTGLNYSTTRFILPSFFALLLHRRLRASVSPAKQAIAILLTAPCFALLLLVSPEMALAFAIGMAGYFAVVADRTVRSNQASYILLLLLLGTLTWIGSACGLFLTLNAFRAGGLNFPVMPALPILLFLAILAIVSAYAGAALRTRHDSPQLVLIAVSVVMIAGALGRCDGGHVLLNPLGIWISGLAIAATWPLVGRILLWSALLVFFLLPIVSGLRGVVVAPARAALLLAFAIERSHPALNLNQKLLTLAARLYGPEKAILKLNEARRFADLHDGLDLGQVFGYPTKTIFQAPFQFTPEQFGPIHSSQVDTGYFYATLNLVTPAEVEQKVAELAVHPERPLLLLPDAENTCGFSPDAERLTIRKIFLYPYAAPVRHPNSILEPICAYIRTHYSLARPATPNRLGYAVWERLSANLTAPDAQKALHPGHP